MGDLRPEHLVYVCFTLAGILFGVLLLRTRFPGWLGYPLVLLIFQAVRDLGTGPIILEMNRVTYDSALFYVLPEGQEAFRGASVLFLHYISVALGLLMIWWLGKVIYPFRPRTDVLRDLELGMLKRGWYVGMVFFFLGVCANLISLTFVLRSFSLLELARFRAVFTDEAALSNPIYGYARLLTSFTLTGALAMFIFSNRNKGRVFLATLAIVIFVGFETLYGGRGRVLTGLVCFWLAYTSVGYRISLRMIILMGAIGSGALIALNSLRFGIGDFSSGFTSALFDLMGADYGRLGQTIWIMRIFPDVINYTGWQNLVGAIAAVIPRLEIPGTGSMWEYVVEYFYGGVSPYRGIGGVNYASAAETYSWGGVPTVVFFGILAGAFYGLIFEWQRRSPWNKFLQVYVIQVVGWYFFVGLQARMPDFLGRAMLQIVPIAVMAALTVHRKDNMPFLTLLWFDFVAILAWYEFRDLLDLSWLRIGVLATVPLVYVFSFRVLSRASIPSQSRSPVFVRNVQVHHQNVVLRR